jgi:hypothetical protein
VFRLLAGGKEIALLMTAILDVIMVKAAPKVSRIFYAGPTTKTTTSPALTAGAMMVSALMQA